MLIAIVLVLIILWAVICRKNGYKRPKYTKQEKQVIKEFRTKKAEDSVKIMRVSIVGTGEKQSTGSTIGRAVIGDLVAGAPGAVVGSLTGKKQGTTKFLVEFFDGHKTIETVKDNSYRFNELIKYIGK